MCSTLSEMNKASSIPACDCQWPYWVIVQIVGQHTHTWVRLPPVRRILHVAVLLSESHETSFPVLRGCDLGHPLSVYLQDSFHWRWLSWYFKISLCASGPPESLGLFVGMILSTRAQPVTGLSLLKLRRAYVPRLLGASGSRLACPCFSSFRLTHADSFGFARWCLPTPGTRCLWPSTSAGMLELLAPCSGMSEQLTRERGGSWCYLSQVSHYCFVPVFGWNLNSGFAGCATAPWWCAWSLGLRWRIPRREPLVR
jgi:hypothetical protein